MLKVLIRYNTSTFQKKKRKEEMELTFFDRIKALFIYIYQVLKGNGTWATVLALALSFFVPLETINAYAGVIVQVLGVALLLFQANPKVADFLRGILDGIVARKVQKAKAKARKR